VDDATPDAGLLDAGPFGAWLDGMQHALDGGTGTDVPCGTCTACCTASQFVHIGPDETDTLAHIPSELLFPAPLVPRGQMLLGYDERGHCPMLGDEGCTIYEHRPRTCRTYDCRVFAAAGIEPDDDLIDQRVERWRFTTTTTSERQRARALARAAAALDALDDSIPDSPIPPSATQRAVLAVELHGQFLGHDPVSGEPSDVTPTTAELLAAVETWSPVR